MSTGEPPAALRFLESEPKDLRDALGQLDRGEGQGVALEELLTVLLGSRRSRRGLDRVRRFLESACLETLARTAPRAWRSGLSASERSRVAAALELGRRLAPAGSGVPSVRGPRDVYDLTADLRRERREHFVGIYLTTRSRILARETISVGSLNASIVHPREVFEPALRHGAASLIVVHNHPSGETDPSEDDLAITRRLSEAGELLGVPLLDHVIVGFSGFTSLKEGRYR